MSKIPNLLISSVDGGGYGQNIGAGQTPEQVPAMIGNSMYNTEMPNYPTPYGNPNPDMANFDHWGHFSQIVWKATTEVGCATQECDNGVQDPDSNDAGPFRHFTVCNYKPPGMSFSFSPLSLAGSNHSLGNIQGAYDQVGAPLGQPIVIIEPS